MAQAVAAEGVAAEQDHVHRKDKCPNPDPETVGELRRRDRVIGEDHDEDNSYVKKVAVNVLKYQREFFLASVLVTRFADGAAGRVGPKGFVICTAVVIAGEPKSAGGPKDQERGRDGKNQIGQPC